MHMHFISKCQIHNKHEWQNLQDYSWRYKIGIVVDVYIYSIAMRSSI